MNIHFILPTKVVSELNKAGHEHWAKTANRRKQHRFMGKLMTSGQIKPKWDGQPITVTFTRLMGKGGRKFYDSGGLIGLILSLLFLLIFALLIGNWKRDKVYQEELKQIRETISANTLAINNLSQILDKYILRQD